MISNAEHAEGLVCLDEAHASHVGREIVDQLALFERLLARFLFLKIKLPVFNVSKLLEPFPEGLHVDGANMTMSLPSKVGHQMPTDETARPRKRQFSLDHS